MIEIILGTIVILALLILIVVIYHNRFKISIIKMEEAENNIDLFLQKKIDLLKRAQPVVKKELKLDDFLEELFSDTVNDLNFFELNDLLKRTFNQFF